MNMKRMLSAVTAISLMGGYAAMAEGNDKVEITFRVGDSVLTVNGAPLEVTAPYVVGEGTTLVPVRVITEAFGAEVNWNGDDQSVNLKYPDVDITIKIGSKVATVNTHAEELLAAPELYMDTTMVPLRFISETFGADVSYDNGLITVTKEAVEEGTTVEGATDMEYIGDSYYGWSVKNPKKMNMVERDFDGTYTSFENGDDWLDFYVDIYDENIDIDTAFSELKNKFESMTLSQADKVLLGNGVTKITLAGKDKEFEKKLVAYMSGKNRYVAYAKVGVDSELKNEILAMMDTFMINSTREMYDLSNVVNGYRNFKDDTYKVTLKLPASWASKDTDVNRFYFYDTQEDKGYVSIGIYSKSETVSAYSMAASDRETRLNVINKDLVTVSEVTKTSLNNMDAYVYTVAYNSDGLDKQYFMNDTFVECGDYVYNIAVEEKTPEDAGAILKTFGFEKLDSSVIGTMLRSQDIMTMNKFSVLNGKVTASSMWSSVASNLLMDARTGSALMFLNMGTSSSSTELSEMMHALYNKMVKEDSCRGVKSVSTNRVDSLGTVYTFTVVRTPEDGDAAPNYTTVYGFKTGSTNYMATFIRSDIYYNSGLEAEVKSIVESYTKD